MNNLFKVLSFITTLIIGANTFAADGYIYRFKDKTGKIIYTDRLPANEKGEFTILSSKTGVIKKVVEKELNEEEVQERNDQQQVAKQAVENNLLQRKKDTSLLSTYSNVEEIDHMKKYELDQIDQGIKNNIDNIANLKDKLSILEENKKISPNNKNIETEYNKTLDNLNSIQQTLDANKSMYAQREKKYSDDKERYLQILKEMSATKNINLENESKQ